MPSFHNRLRLILEGSDAQNNGYRSSKRGTIWHTFPFQTSPSPKSTPLRYFLRIKRTETEQREESASLTAPLTEECIGKRGGGGGLPPF